jgi:hypothetical protein
VDTRVVFCGDNLDQLRKLPDTCVDLIYIDPPFNSNRGYEVFWGERREKRAGDDRHASTQAYIEFTRLCPSLRQRSKGPQGPKGPQGRQRGSRRAHRSSRPLSPFGPCGPLRPFGLTGQRGPRRTSTVAFDYSQDALTETNRFLTQSGKAIVALTVKEIPDEQIAMKLV